MFQLSKVQEAHAWSTLADAIRNLPSQRPVEPSQPIDYTQGHRHMSEFHSGIVATLCISQQPECLAILKETSK